MELIKSNVSQFNIGEAKFIIDISPGYNRRPSDDEAFTIVKTQEFLNLYISLAAAMRPKSILELGVFQGGGFVFFDSLFCPKAMAAVELSPTPIEPLLKWLSTRPGRFVHFGHNQTDAELLQRIVQTELGGILDLVIDDASHLYDETRRSFEILFPLMAPGGNYIIEDWSWAHSPLYQGAEAPNARKAALTNLIFDLTMLHGSTSFIAEVRIYRPFVVVRKAVAPVQIPSDFWSLIKNRDKQDPRI